MERKIASGEGAKASKCRKEGRYAKYIIEFFNIIK